MKINKVWSVILSACLGALCMPWIGVQAEETESIEFHVTYLGPDGTDPVYVFNDIQGDITLGEHYTPLTNAYQVTDGYTGDMVAQGTMEEGLLTIPSSERLYTITIYDVTAGQTIHVAEQNGQEVKPASGGDNGVSVTVSSAASANRFDIQVGNAVSADSIPLPEETADAAPIVSAENTAAPETVITASPAASEPADHGCSVLGSDYVWESSSNTCVQRKAAASPSAAADLHGAFSTQQTLLLVSASALAVLGIFWAVQMIKKHG